MPPSKTRTRTRICTRSPCGSSPNGSCRRPIPRRPLELRLRRLSRHRRRGRHLQLPRLHHRGDLEQEGTASSGATSWSMPTATTCRTCCPVDQTLHWANPPGGMKGRDTRPSLHEHARALHRPGAHRHPRARRPHHRRQRRLRRSLVPAGRQQYPQGLRRHRHFLRLLQQEVQAQVGSRNGIVQLPERPARHHALVPRPHAGHDPAERLRRPGRLLPDPRRPGRCRAGQPGRQHLRSCRAGPRCRRRPAWRIRRDPHRGPGPLLQRRRLAVLPGHPGLLR